MIGQPAGKSFAYILGVYLGDGCVTRVGPRKVFSMSTIDPEFAEAVRGAFFEYGATGGKIYGYMQPHKSKRMQYSMQIKHDAICKTLQEDTKCKQAIPPYVFDWPTENRSAFVQGLMDSEGFVAANSNKTNRRYYMGFKSCDVWVPDFIKILQGLDIKIGKVQIEEPLLPHYKPPTRFTIKMASWVKSGIKFSIKRKQRRVEEWASCDAYTQRARHPRRLTSETNTLDLPFKGEMTESAL